MAGDLDEAERMLAAELIPPLSCPNSSFSQTLTDRPRDAAAAAVEPVTRRASRQGEIVVRNGKPLDAADIETIEALGLGEDAPPTSRASRAGSCCRSWSSAMLLAWIWRFRPTLWHRDNVLLLIGLLLVGTTLALKVTAGRDDPRRSSCRPRPSGCSLAILLDASRRDDRHGRSSRSSAARSTATRSSSRRTSSSAAWPASSPSARAIGCRSSSRPAIAVFVVNALVVSVFSLLGARDIRGVLELWFASAASAAGSSVAAVGTFAVLGSVFGILTVFQLLELANPSQPLLRRLLVETPGTYHHSLMVGNLAERAAEAIGADPLVTRVAAYYHDVGKLANPLAFIENQAGGENIHDQLEPEVSAQILKQHVADGIDIAYAAQAAQGAHRLHPAAPRDGDHELLLRQGAGARRGAVRRPRHRRGREGGRRGRRAPVPPRRARSRRPARRP